MHTLCILMTKTMMQDAMSNESTERVKKVVNDYACKVHIFKVFFWFQDQFVLQAGCFRVCGHFDTPLNS